MVAERPGERMQELVRYFRDRCDPPTLFARYVEVLARCRVDAVAAALRPTGRLLIDITAAAAFPRFVERSVTEPNLMNGLWARPALSRRARDLHPRGRVRPGRPR